MGNSNHGGSVLAVSLRVGAADFDVDAFLKSHPVLKPSAVFHRGERLSARRVAEVSGFNLSVAEDDAGERAVGQALTLLERLRPILNELREQRVDLELDFGLAVGSREAFVSGVSLEPEQLRMLADLGIGLTVTGYPCSDNDE